MDLGKAARLQKSREALAAKLAAYDAGTAREDAEAFRATLVAALDELRSLYGDDELWAVARSTVAHAQFDDIAEQLDGLSESLPPLFELFGYRTPPPPPADQLVRGAVALVQRAGSEYPSVAEIDEAHAALGALLERTVPLARASLAPPSWEVARAAAETLPAIEAGTTVAIAAAGGAIATVVASAALGAVTGGVGALAGVLIIGGVRKWRRKRAAHRFDADLDRYREELAGSLLPAVQGATLYHLDVIAGLLERPNRDGDVLTWIDLEDHIDEVLGFTRRFAADNQHLRTQANQARLQGNMGPAQFLLVLKDVYAAAIAAQRVLAGQLPMDWSPIEVLAAERDRLGGIRLIPA